MAQTPHAQNLIGQAIAAIQGNDFRQALELLNRTEQASGLPEHAQLLKAQCHHALGEYGAAADGLLALLHRAPENAFYHHSLALVYNDCSMPESAREHALRATALAPAQAEVWVQLSLAEKALGNAQQAFAAADKAVHLSNGNQESLKARAYAALLLHDDVTAGNDFNRRMRDAFAPALKGSFRSEFIHTTAAKLKHDAEQYAYLHGLGRGQAFQNLAEMHYKMLSELPADLATDQIITLSQSTVRAFEGSYNRLHHFVDAPRVTGSAIRTERDFRAIEADYRNRQPGITWIDDFLKPGTLKAIRDYCLENTFWFDFHHPNGYLGALMENGFAAPLLFQIAQELRENLPAIFKDLPLIQMWAFKYDSQLKGIQMHADIAAVNLNFWITPDESNLDDESGGLVIWDKEAPQDWHFKDFNTGESDRQQRITEFLESSGANRVRVPYRQNRAVLFNSDLFHSTDHFHFKDGYTDRRINITLLFGQR